MQLVIMIFSALLLSVVPSFGIYAICQYYFNMDPLYINLITGVFMFIFGGVLIARSGDTKKDPQDGTNS